MKIARYLSGLTPLVVLVAMLVTLLAPVAGVAQAALTLTIVSGDNQSAFVTTPFKKLQVVVKNAEGKAVPGVVVTYTAPASGPSTSPATFTATSDAKGIASGITSAGNTVGGPYQVLASAGDQSILFHLTNVGVTLAQVAGDGQHVAVGSAFPGPLQVKVTDSAGKTVSGAVVTFTAPASGASTHPPTFTATSDAGGVASATATANRTVGGPYGVVATIGDQSATFQLTNRIEYYLNSYPYDDPLTNSTWWRDTANQNALAEHTAHEFTGTVHQVYSTSQLTVLVYSSVAGANVTAVLTANNVLLVGAGGGLAEALAAKNALSDAYSGFMGKTLRGIVLPDALTDSTWGEWLWRSWFHAGPEVTIASGSYFDAVQRTSTAEKEYLRRQIRVDAKVKVCDPNDPSNCGYLLPWGRDSFLGTGWAAQYRPTVSSYAPPSAASLITTTTVLIMDGQGVLLIPREDGAAGLLTYVSFCHIAGGSACPANAPGQPGGFSYTGHDCVMDLNDPSCWVYEDANDPIAGGIMIVGNAGAYFPNVGSIAQPPVSVEERMATLDYIRGLSPADLLMEHALPVSGAAAVSTALTDQYSALSYVRTETLKCISYGDDVDDIVATVKLPSPLAGSPYLQEFVGTVGFAVREIYHEYLGWFTGDLVELSGGLTTEEQARMLVDLAGGPNGALNFARQAATDGTVNGAKRALYVLEALRKVNPSEEANALYISALRHIAWSTTSAEVRNYLLIEAAAVERGY